MYLVLSTILDQWSSTEGRLLPRVQLAMSGDITDSYDLVGVEITPGI